MAELLQKRTYTSKTLDNGDGTFTLEAHIGHIHYKDGLGDLVDVDYTLEDMGTYWRMVKANYRLYVAKDFGAPDLIRFDNRYEGANHSIYYEPHSLRWVNNPDLSDMSTWRTAQAVTGVLSGNKVRYTDAFGSGIHFEITLRRHGFKKEIVIDTLTDLANPPTPDHRLTLISRYRGDNLTIIKEDAGASDWDNDSYYESLEGFRIEEFGNRSLKSFIRKAYAVDSDPERPGGNRIPLKMFWKKINGALWQAKILPSKAQFQLATFPVRADADTFYAESGDGHIEGWIGATTWDAVHDMDPGYTLSYVGDTFYCGPYGSGANNNRGIARSFCPFLTSGLGAGSTVTAATLSLWLSSFGNGDDDAYDYVTIVQTNQADQTDPLTLTTADYDQCGDSVDDPTEGIDSGDRLGMTGQATGEYKDFSLNATGMGWINVTGYTLLGVREGHDTADEEFTLGAGYTSNISFWSASEETAGAGGTDQDPKLVVTYTPGGLSIPGFFGSTLSPVLPLFKGSNL